MFVPELLRYFSLDSSGKTTGQLVQRHIILTFSSKTSVRSVSRVSGREIVRLREKEQNKFTK